MDIAPDAALGLIAEKTGIPTRSRSVIFAILVTPIFGRSFVVLASVVSGSKTRWVPSRYLTFGSILIVLIFLYSYWISIIYLIPEIPYALLLVNYIYKEINITGKKVI